MLLRLQRYDLRVHYRPGKELVIADYLSRIPSQPAQEEQFTVGGIAQVAIADERLNEYQEATAKDQALVLLLRFYREGWPDDKRMVPNEIRSYWPYRDEIHAEEGLVMRSNRVIIPQHKRCEVLKQLHSAHCGEEKMKTRARYAVFWPGMSSDIEQYVKRCAECQEDRPAKQKEPLKSTPVPELPWQIVSADILYHDGYYYHVVVDHYSFYFEIIRLNGLATGSIIRSLFQVFQRFGLPEQLRTDNGPQYASEEFRALMKRYDIAHVTSSPHYAQSNGMAERAVREAKKLLRKIPYGTPEFYVALLEWRTTPRSDRLGAPSERLMARRLRTLVPIHRKQLVPKVLSPEKVRAALLEERCKQKFFYDRHAKQQPPISEGQSVSIHDPLTGKWQPGVVVSLHSAPRSYVVREERSNRTIRRTKSHLRPIPSKIPQQPYSKPTRAPIVVHPTSLPAAPPWASRRWPRRSRSASSGCASRPTCSTATTCATGSTPT